PVQAARRGVRIGIAGERAVEAAGIAAAVLIAVGIAGIDWADVRIAAWQHIRPQLRRRADAMARPGKDRSPVDHVDLSRPRDERRTRASAGRAAAGAGLTRDAERERRGGGQ